MLWENIEEIPLNSRCWLKLRWIWKVKAVCSVSQDAKHSWAEGIMRTQKLQLKCDKCQIRGSFFPSLLITLLPLIMKSGLLEKEILKLCKKKIHIYANRCKHTQFYIQFYASVIDRTRVNSCVLVCQGCHNKVL